MKLYNMCYNDDYNIPCVIIMVIIYKTTQQEIILGKPVIHHLHFIKMKVKN